MRKNIIGVIIIVLAFVLIFGWEFYGREQFSYKPTLVVTATVEKGQTITSNLLAERRLPQEALVDGSMVMQDVSQLVGKVAKHYMARNSQITINDVYEKDLYIKGMNRFIKFLQMDQQHQFLCSKRRYRCDLRCERITLNR